MTSRTLEGKHVTRFIVLEKASFDEKFVRSNAVPGHFETRELAQSGIDRIQAAYPNVTYKVRQK